MSHRSGRTKTFTVAAESTRLGLTDSTRTPRHSEFEVWQVCLGGEFPGWVGEQDFDGRLENYSSGGL
ncbi:unnamed protein product [Calypogeia fissa]